MTRTFLQDMLEQPDKLEQLVSFYKSSNGGNMLELLSQLGENKTLLFSGMGSSLAASRFAVTYLWSVGKQAMYIEASELLHYGMPILSEDSLLVLISQSGESVEIKEILEALPDKITLIGITSDMGSTLAQKSTVALPLLCGEESTTSSKTYTASIAVVFLVAQVLAGLDRTDVFRAITNASLTLLGQTKETDYQNMANKLLKAKSIHFIGRGPGVSTAIQGALTFKELVKMQVECMEAAQFRHGPLETVGPDTLVIVFASEGRTQSLLLSFATKLQECGAVVFIVKEGKLFEHDSSHAETLAAKVEAVNEFASALTDIFPIQVIANSLAEQLGTTGEFKWITKVTAKQ
jgi:glucosamine--fructose-6-phosphate aminotransferase (isomerizing)